MKMKKLKIPKEITDVLFELGIELLKTFKDLNSKDKLQLTSETKTEERKNDDTTENTDRDSKKNITLSD